MSSEQIAEFHSLYIDLPPYLKLGWEQIRHILTAYPAAWQHRYPEMKVRLDGHRLERKSGGFWAIYYRDRETAYLIALSPTGGSQAVHKLEWIFETLYRRGLRRVIFGGIRDPFGLGWSGLSPSLRPIVDCLVEHFGYQISETWILLERQHLAGNLDNIAVQKNDHLHFHYRDHPGLGEWTVEAFWAQNPIGECQAWSIPDYFQDLIPDLGWSTLEWMEVAENFRRQNIGSELLRRQMQHQSNKGYRHLIAWTEAENQIARSFIEKNNFRELGEVMTLTPPA